MNYIQTSDSISVPANVQQIMLSYVGIADRWIMFAIGENDYICCIEAPFKGDRTIHVYRDIGRVWHVAVSDFCDNLTYSVTNEYYVLSNTGQGVFLQNPHALDVCAWALVIVTCFVALQSVFKGVFKWVVQKR